MIRRELFIGKKTKRRQLTSWHSMVGKNKREIVVHGRERVKSSEEEEGHERPVGC